MTAMKPGACLEHPAQAFALGAELPLRADFFGDLDDDCHHTRRLAAFIEQRRIIEIEPRRLRAAMAGQHQFKIAISQRSASQSYLHDVVVEVSDFGPSLADPGSEQLRMPLSGELGIGIVVDHDAVLTPQRHDRNRRAQDRRQSKPSGSAARIR